MGFYYATNAAGAQTVISPYTHHALAVTNPNNPQTITWNLAASETTGSIYFTSPNVGLTSWPAGFYSWLMNVLSQGSSISFPAGSNIVRNSNLTLPDSSWVWSSTTGTGLRTLSSNASASTTSATDFITARWQLINGNMMSAEALSIQVGDANAYLQVPWDVGEPPPSGDTPRPAYIGGGYYG